MSKINFHERVPSNAIEKSIIESEERYGGSRLNLSQRPNFNILPITEKNVRPNIEHEKQLKVISEMEIIFFLFFFPLKTLFGFLAIIFIFILNK